MKLKLHTADCQLVISHFTFHFISNDTICTIRYNTIHNTHWCHYLNTREMKILFLIIRLQFRLPRRTLILINKMRKIPRKLRNIIYPPVAIFNAAIFILQMRETEKQKQKPKRWTFGKADGNPWIDKFKYDEVWIHRMTFSVLCYINAHIEMEMQKDP